MQKTGSMVLSFLQLFSECGKSSKNLELASGLSIRFILYNDP